MDYSVIIPTHNEGQNLVDTVATLAAAVECCDRHQSGMEIVVVDDQSTMTASTVFRRSTSGSH